MENRNENGLALINSLFITFSLGISLIFLGFLRNYNVSISQTTLLGISIASYIIVIGDFLIFVCSSFERKFFKFINKHIVLLMMLVNIFAMFFIICLPFLPLISNQPPEEISRLSDSNALFAFGLTIGVIGLKGFIDVSKFAKKKEKEIKLLQQKIIELESINNQK